MKAPAVQVPFLDLCRINARFQAEMDEAFARVCASGRVLHGAETEAFETEFAQWCGVRHCVAVGNGLEALQLVLQAWISLDRLRLGDEVLVPANSFVASALAATEAGLSVRLADVDVGTFNLSEATTAAALTGQTRAVMPVHLYGRLADSSGIRALCDRESLLFLEDAAQAHGATSTQGRAGAIGDAAGFSFYPAKNLGALGDAGCVVTNDEALAARVRMLGNYGSTTKYQHDLKGCNSRIDEIQAAVLRIKLRHVDADNEARRQIATIYRERITNRRVTLPATPDLAESHVWHQFVVRAQSRDDLAEHLRRVGVETIVHYPRAIYANPAFAELASGTNAPGAHRLQDEVLSLPMSPVMTDDQVNHVVASVNAWQGADDSERGGR
jgi:dTDP-4-amino-4,6-dideoxygalactose transaminase